MSETQRRLLERLADGRFHSGSELGEAMSVSRAAIWKHVRALERFGLDVHAVRGKGYRLSRPIELLRSASVEAAMSPDARRLSGSLDILADTESTNSWLMRRTTGAGCRGNLCIAEYQHAGRGRRGRDWSAPFGGAILLSLSWWFPQPPESLTSLSLLAGAAAIIALEKTGVGEVGLKWPNDLLWRDRKLAGVLLEMAGETHGPCRVVAGIGLNFHAGGPEMRGLDRPWVDLHEMGYAGLSRNRLAGAIASEWITAFDRCERSGIRGLAGAWQSRDLLRDLPVTLEMTGGTCSGIAAGIDHDGALLLASGGVRKRFLSGEVSVRHAF